MSRWIALVVLFCFAAPAVAQDCLIGVYGDPEGTIGGSIPDRDGRMSLYVVMHAESTVAAAAYSMIFYELNREVFLQARFSGPNGDGLALDEVTGTNVALRECVVGFGGNPVLVDEYVFWVVQTFREAIVEIGPNPSQNTKQPVYATCNDLIKECTAARSICVGGWCFISTEPGSFSTIKSLYHKD